MSRRVWLLVICVVMLLSGCSEGSRLSGIFGRDNEPEPLLTVYVSDVVWNYRTLTKEERQLLSVSKVEQYYLQRFNELVRKNGFKIKFVPIPTEFDQSGTALNYETTCRKYLLDLDAGNRAILLPSLSSDLDELIDNLRNQNMYAFAQVSEDEFKQWAPYWYEYNKDYLYYYPNAIPAGQDITFYTPNPFLFIRDEVALRYGQQINTLDDYGKFLYWCQKEFPNLTPSAIMYGSTQQFSGGPLDIITLVYGSLDGYPLDELSNRVMGLLLDKNETSFNIKPVEEDQQFRKALKQIVRWREDGLIRLIDCNDPGVSFDGLASLQINPCYIRDTYINNEMILKQYDMKDLQFILKQTPYTLYNGINPDNSLYAYPYGLSYLGANASPEAIQEWLTFLEWLHINRENYRSLLWGEEGVDYEMVNDIYTPIQNEEIAKDQVLDYRFDLDFTNLFNDNRYPLIRSKVIDTGRLQNAVDACVYPEMQGFDERDIRQNLGLALMNRNINGLGALDSRKKALSDMITRVITSVDYQSVDGFIDEFQRLQKNTCDQVIPVLTSLLELEKKP